MNDTVNKMIRIEEVGHKVATSVGFGFAWTFDKITRVERADHKVQKEKGKFEGTYREIITKDIGIICRCCM